MLVYPEYYPQFRCIASQCSHSCCIGWEIDIDEESLAVYEQMDGEIGQRLRENIIKSGDGACFRLDEKERCPFLNADGLCELILANGEETLCQICADHPRFRNYFSERVEMGVGLCCEAAAQLILGWEAPVRLLQSGDAESLTEDERMFVHWRDRLMAAAQDRSVPMEDRLTVLQNESGCPIKMSPDYWYGVYAGMEQLEPSWQLRLQSLKGMEEAPKLTSWQSFASAFEQLLVYFVFRHLAGALDDGKFDARLRFATLSTYIIGWLAAAEKKKTGELNMDTLVEIARQYSAEIEYSDENLDVLLQILEAK